jgi:selenoprotein W-related protein
VEIDMIPSSGGVFDVSADGTLIFSKKQAGRHAAPGEVLRLLQSRGK